MEGTDWACATCHQPLNTYQAELGAPKQLLHAAEIIGETVDHETVPVPRDSIEVSQRCDFCGTGDIAAVVRAHPFSIASQWHDGGWAGCEKCASLVRDEDWAGLLKRASRVIERSRGVSLGSDGRFEMRRLYEELSKNLIGVEWLPGRKPKGPAPQAKPQPVEETWRPTVRFAKDVPEAQSRLLRYLEGSAAENWAIVLDVNGVTTVVGVDEDLRTIAHGDGGHYVPSAFDKGNPVDTAKALAAWQAQAIRDSAPHFVSEDATRRTVEMAETLPDFRLVPEVVTHESGLLCWATPVSAGPNTAGQHAEVVAASWCPVAFGLWVTFYVDVSRTEFPPELRAEMGWLIETGTYFIPWGKGVHKDDKTAPVGLMRAFHVLVCTWVRMNQEIVDVSAVEAAPKDARKIRRRGHPVQPVSYITLPKVVRHKLDEEPIESEDESKRKPYSKHRGKVTGHFRHYKADRYDPKLRLHPQWIDEYWKGDPSLPVLDRKVYVINK